MTQWILKSEAAAVDLDPRSRPVGEIKVRHTPAVQVARLDGRGRSTGGTGKLGRDCDGLRFYCQVQIAWLCLVQLLTLPILRNMHLPPAQSSTMLNVSNRR
jgi:hypothetical protein